MFGKPRILVVEGDRNALHRTEMILRELGTTPRCLTNGDQAITVVNLEKFDGVLIDWDRCGIEAPELARRIRHSRSNAKVPISVMAELSSGRPMTDGFQEGVTFFMAKPIGPTELRRLVNASRGAMLEERRRYQRADLSVGAFCSWEGMRAKGRTVNVSATGLLLRLDECPEAGSPVEVSFPLPPTRQQMNLEALVARTTPRREVGVRFVGLSREQSELLKAYTVRALAVAGRA